MIIRNTREMIDFISAIRNSDRYIRGIYINGGCYQFHLILKRFAPNCSPKINARETHVVTYFMGRHFDISGEVKGDFRDMNEEQIEIAKQWSFAKYHAIQIGECEFCEEPIIV